MIVKNIEIKISSIVFFSILIHSILDGTSFSQPVVKKDFAFMHWRRKWQPTPVFLPGESQGWGAWWAAIYGVAQSQTRLKQLSSSSQKRARM